MMKETKNKVTIFGIIPARFQSNRFPGKLLALLGTKSVIRTTYENSIKSQILDEIYIATDSQEIANHVAQFGAKTIFTSPKCRNGTDRIVNALMHHDFLKKSEIIINIQGDHPFISPKTIETLCSILLSNESSCIATIVSPIRNLEEYLSPDIVKCVVSSSNRALYFSRAPIPYSSNQQLPLNCFAHHGIYGFRTQFLLEEYKKLAKGFLCDQEDLEQLQFLENDYPIKVGIVEERVMGINTPKDLEQIYEHLCQ